MSDKCHMSFKKSMLELLSIINQKRILPLSSFSYLFIILEAEPRASAELFVYDVVVQFYLVLALLVMLFLHLCWCVKLFGKAESRRWWN